MKFIAKLAQKKDMVTKCSKSFKKKINKKYTNHK
jgi:hypothetical protein